jgi:hypothetical protein
VAGHFDWALGLHAGEHVLGAGGVDLFGIPSGTSSASRACSRHALLFRARPRSLLRFANSRSTPVSSAHVTDASPGARSAATATGCASLGSFLFDRPVPKHSHPCRQRRRHVQDLLAGVEELLGQQIAEPTGGLDRPRALLEARRPLQQLIDLAARRSHLHLGEPRLVLVLWPPRCATLVGIHADHHPSTASSSVAFYEAAAGTPD